MEQQSRLTIRSNFRTGDRPTQEDFENVFESFINFLDEGMSVDSFKNLNIGGSITLKDNADNEPATAGTIRWNGTEFEGHNGTAWGPLGGGGGGGQWNENSGNLTFDTGNVGIGTASPSTDVLEVEVGSSKRARLGNAALGNGPTNITKNNALFSHTSLRTAQSYALMQDPDGNTSVNCPNSKKIEFKINNIAQAAMVSNNFVVGSRDLQDTNPAYRLQVSGSAFKNDGNDSWNNTSDIRTKEDISGFNEGLELLKRVTPIRFKYNGKANTRKGLECIGINAQEIEKVFPYMVFHSESEKERSGLDSDEVLTTNLSALKFVMVNAIKELDNRIEKLEYLLKSNDHDRNQEK